LLISKKQKIDHCKNRDDDDDGQDFAFSIMKFDILKEEEEVAKKRKENERDPRMVSRRCDEVENCRKKKLKFNFILNK
jgi:hypothetical protein